MPPACAQSLHLNPFLALSTALLFDLFHAVFIPPLFRSHAVTPRQVNMVADPLAAARDSQLSIFSHNKRQVLALQVRDPNSPFLLPTCSVVCFPLQTCKRFVRVIFSFTYLRHPPPLFRVKGAQGPSLREDCAAELHGWTGAQLPHSISDKM